MKFEKNVSVFSNFMNLSENNIHLQCKVNVSKVNHCFDRPLNYISSPNETNLLILKKIKMKPQGCFDFFDK